MSLINPDELTAAAIYLTLTGQAPAEIWLPLFEDIARIAAEYVLRFLEVLL